MISPPTNKLRVNSSMPKAMDNVVATTADNGTNKETVKASIYFIAQALATQHSAVQTIPKNKTSTIDNQSNETANVWNTAPSKINVYAKHTTVKTHNCKKTYHSGSLSLQYTLVKAISRPKNRPPIALKPSPKNVT